MSTDTTGARDDDCRTPLYAGTCQAVSKCESVGQLIAQQRLRDVDVESCRDGTFEEIICCPMSVPLQPRGQVSTATRVGNEIEGAGDAAAAAATTPNPVGSARSLASADELLPHYQHLAALAFPNAAFDGHVHRCTAVALTPKLLLTAAGCGRPSHAVFGVADMRDVDEEEDDLVEITVRVQLSLPLTLFICSCFCFCCSTCPSIARIWLCCACCARVHSTRRPYAASMIRHAVRLAASWS